MHRPALRTALTALLVATLVSAPAASQYFGRNKVKWESFDFEVTESPHFELYSYPAKNRAASDGLRMAERWYERLSGVLDHGFDGKKPIVLYSNHADFQQTNITGGLIGEGTGGFTEPFKSRVVLPLTGLYADTDHVIGHELVHAFQFDMATRERGVGRQERSGLSRMPLWMIEGLAEYLSQGREDALTSMWLRDSVANEKLPDIDDLARDPRYSPYQYGQALWAYIGGRWGDDAVVDMFRAALAIGPEAAVIETLGVEPKDLTDAWHGALNAHYRSSIDERTPPDALGRPVLTEERTKGRINMAPALSPDGERVAFISTRNLFTLDLFVADADSGEVLGQIASAATDSHYDSLRFLDTSGTWSPNGERFAFVVFAEGSNEIVVVDVTSGDVDERIRIDGIGSISNPTWTPDGRHLVFSATARGASDLYRYDLTEGETVQLTDDLYGDLQPTVAPDGETVAFVSDRGAGTDLDRLTYAPAGIHLLDVGSGEIRPLPLFEFGKAINPQFSPDGRVLYFVADPDGVANVYAVDVGDGAGVGEIRQITDVASGVSGITELSPALSVASETGRMMVTLFDDGEYAVHEVTNRGDAETSPAAPQASSERTAAVLPPATPESVVRVGEYLADSEGVPADAEAYAGRDYAPKLSLVGVGPATVGVGGTDRGDFGFGGALSFFFSDILGDHQVGVSIAGSSGGTRDFADSIAAQASYLNRKNRLQWGGAVTHIPFESARTAVTRQPVEIDGEVVIADVFEQLREQVVIDGIEGIVEYPFSQTRRVELGAGYDHYSFDREIERVAVVGNRVIDRDLEQLPSGSSLDLLNGSVAYVGDNSFYGFASPVRGGRVRLEVGSVGGSLQYQTALADARKYFFFRPVTLALRGLHFGRYGSDAESDRLSQLYVGRATLVRGYSIGDFSLSECTTGPDVVGCPEFDRLVGSRLAVANVELRLPLLGTEQFGLFEGGFFPTELGVFADAGVAWTQDESPEIEFTERTTARVPVVSAGVTLRTVLGGALPIEVYYAVPFQRPEVDEEIGFVISPGW